MDIYNQSNLHPFSATKLPIATVECQENGEFGEPIFIDCSAERYELTNDELISYSVAATADPSTITADSATFAIDSTSEVVQNQSSITSTVSCSFTLTRILHMKSEESSARNLSIC